MSIGTSKEHNATKKADVRFKLRCARLLSYEQSIELPRKMQACLQLEIVVSIALELTLH